MYRLLPLCMGPTRLHAFAGLEHGLARWPPAFTPPWAITETQSVHVYRVKPIPWWAGTLVWNASAKPRSEL
jgi:hypothetical protein